jgi:hypothetical protein
MKSGEWTGFHKYILALTRAASNRHSRSTPHLGGGCFDDMSRLRSAAVSISAMP